MTAPRILVVEDERIVALHLRQQLIKLGYEVPVAAASGEQALREIETLRPDLVLMDINIKGEFDGIVTASRIPRDRHIPVIYLTAYSEDATLVRASATNPYGYLLKPFSERELHAMIQVTLARCHSEQVARAARECELQARKMEALGQLAAGVADNFNELLTVVYSQLEILGDPALDRPAMAEPVQDGFRDAIRNEQLLRRLLAFSGRQKLRAAAVSVRDLVAKMGAELRHASGGSRSLRLVLPDDLWDAWIDAGPLARALMDLATNAFDAMAGGGCQGGGCLTIEARNSVLEQDYADGQAEVAAGRYVLLAVTDTGMGMPQDVIERAFEPFFTTKPGGGGAGLGLSLVFGFIRQSGGHISIDSKPGDGTTVRIYLPAAADQAIPRDHGASDGGIAGETLVWRGLDTPRSGAPPDDAGETGRRDQAPSRPGASTIAREANTAAPVLWRNTGDALFAAVEAPAGAVRYRLVIEPLPRRGGWDWTVWRPADAGSASRHGRASSVMSAMAAAEDAARHWHASQVDTD